MFSKGLETKGEKPKIQAWRCRSYGAFFKWAWFITKIPSRWDWGRRRVFS